MSKYSVNESELLKAKQLLLHVENKLAAIIKKIENSRLALEGQSGFGIEQEQYKLNTQKAAIQLQIENVERLRECMQYVMDTTAAANSNAKAELERSELDKSFKDGAAILAEAAAAEEAKKKQEQEKKDHQSTDNGNQGGGGNTNSQNTKSPEQIKRELAAIYQTLRNRRGYTFDGKCGAFVYQQLAHAGITSDGEGVALGKDYYQTWMQRGGTRTGYRVEGHGGSNGLRELVNAHPGEVLQNVVVSFNCDGRNYPSSAGHVVLIHRIENGMVYFMESAGKNMHYGSLTGQTVAEGTPICLSVEDFMKEYPGANGTLYFHR